MKGINAAQFALAGMAALAFSQQPALADTILLVCDRGLPLDKGSATLLLEPVQSTVTLHLPPIGDSISAQTMGPLPAKFSPDEIDFVWIEDGFLRHTYTVNRSTASVESTAVNLRGGPGFNEARTYHVGKNQF